MLGNGTDVLMQVCTDPDTPVCSLMPHVSQHTCSAQVNVTETNLYPGEPCAKDSVCHSFNCTAGICAGKPENSTCLKHIDCDVGLFCGSSNVCKNQKKQGESCVWDYECVNSCGCDKPLFELGKCVSYYSIAIGNIINYCVTDINEGRSRLCSSGTCLQMREGVNGPGICSKPATSVNLGTCQSDADCKGIMGPEGGITFNSTCNCGMSQRGNSYCMTFSGDDPGSATCDYMKLHYLTSVINSCHTATRNKLSCMNKTLDAGEYDQYIKAKMALADPARYMDNDYCTMININQGYFDEGPEALACPAYRCSPVSSLACSYYDLSDNANYLTPCSNATSENYCDWALFYQERYENITCNEPSKVSGLFPGEPCAEDTNCISGKCEYAICVGLSMGDNCTDTSECDVGMRCSTTCQPLLQIGDFGCYKNPDCNIDAGCYILPGKTQGECIPYFSLPIGEYVECLNPYGFQSLCRNATCSIDEKGNGYCTVPPQNTKGFPALCTTDSDCVGMNSKSESFYSTCECGFNSQGNSYCVPFTGDQPGLDFVALSIDLLQEKLVMACHTQMREEISCFTRMTVLLKLSVTKTVQTFYNFYNYGMYLDNDDCVKAMITDYYWFEEPDPPNPPTPPTPDDDDMGWVLGASLSTMILLL